MNQKENKRTTIYGINLLVPLPTVTALCFSVATPGYVLQLLNKFSLYMLSYNINWNYGLLPQTWEDPSFANNEVEGAFGDNDPGIRPFAFVCTFLSYTHSSTRVDTKYIIYLELAVDVVEIGESRRKIGEVLKVKPLGALAMIDEGELDWKIVAISLDDPKAALVNDVDDVEKHFPVCLFS